MMPMLKTFTDDAWDDYLYRQSQDKKTLKRINQLIKDIERNGADQGIGMPEPLKWEFQGFWSRRIDQKNRLVYRVSQDQTLEIIACRTHYGST